MAKSEWGELGFIERVCTALGEHPKSFFLRRGVNYQRDVYPLLKAQECRLAEADIDSVYAALAEAIDAKLGVLIAGREALNRLMQNERKRRAYRLERILNR